MVHSSESIEAVSDKSIILWVKEVYAYAEDNWSWRLYFFPVKLTAQSTANIGEMSHLQRNSSKSIKVIAFVLMADLRLDSEESEDRLKASRTGYKTGIPEKGEGLQ